MKHGFWQEGGGSFGTSAIGFFQQEGERNVLVFCGREGWLLLVGEEKGCSSFSLVVWGCAFLSAGKGGFFWSERVGVSGYPASLYPFLFGFPFRFPFHFHSFYYCLASGACSGREGESLWSEGTAVGFLFSSFVFILLPFILHLLFFLGRVFCFAFLLAGTLSGESG